MSSVVVRTAQNWKTVRKLVGPGEAPGQARLGRGSGARVEEGPEAAEGGGAGYELGRGDVCGAEVREYGMLYLGRRHTCNLVWTGTDDSSFERREKSPRPSQMVFLADQIYDRRWILTSLCDV